MNPVTIIGMGITPDDLTARHLKIIEKADILVGGKRLLDHFKDSPAQKKAIGKDINRITNFVKRQMKTQQIVVLEKLHEAAVDMQTTVFVGSSTSRRYRQLPIQLCAKCAKKFRHLCKPKPYKRLHRLNLVLTFRILYISGLFGWRIDNLIIVVLNVVVK